MAEFHNSWRKRLACQRCRQLKVRCEYSSPTSDQCIRCQKAGTVCIISHPKRKDGQKHDHNESCCDGSANGGNESDSANATVISVTKSKEEHSVYLRRIIRDAELKLAEMNVTPLRQAIAAGLYTLEEANKFYMSFRRNPNWFAAIALLNLPDDILEVDKSWPWLAITIATSQAMNTTGSSFSEMQLFTQNLYRCGLEGESYQITLDRLLGFALMCQYAMSFHERGLGALIHFHGLTLTTVKYLRRMGQSQLADLAAHVAAVTIMPYGCISQFAPVTQTCHYYDKQVNYKDHQDSSTPDLRLRAQISENSSATTVQAMAAGPLVEMILVYERATADLENAQSIIDLTHLVEEAMHTLDLLANHTLVINSDFASYHGYEPDESIPNSENLSFAPLQATYLLVRMQLLKRAARQIFAMRGLFNPEEYKELLHSIISQAAEYAGRLFRGFAHIDHEQPFVRTTTFYHVSEGLLIMQFMRWISFAVGIDIDVRSDCLLSVVTTKWQELIRSSILVRQLYLLLFDPLGLSSIKVGIYDKTSNAVVGSGIMENFEVIYYDSRTRKLKETVPFNRLKLVEVIEDAMRQYEDDINGLPQSPWFENVGVPTLPTVLKLLIYKF